MLKNVDVELVKLDGTPVKSEEGDEVITIKTVVTHALLNARPEGEAPNGDKSVKRYRLALRVNAGGKQEFTSDELALIKALVAAVYSPLVVGQVYDWCDTDPVPVAE